MSKYVKNLIADHLRERLQSVNDALLVNMVGLDANANHRLRTELRAKNIHVLVVKNSLAARADGGHAAGRRCSTGVAGSAADLLGQRGHRQPGQGNHRLIAERASYPPFAGPRRRHGRRAAHRPAGGRGQQVAQPRPSS